MSLPMMSSILRNEEQSAKKRTPHYNGTNARRESVCVCVCVNVFVYLTPAKQLMLATLIYFNIIPITDLASFRLTFCLLCKNYFSLSRYIFL